MWDYVVMTGLEAKSLLEILKILSTIFGWQMNSLNLKNLLKGNRKDLSACKNCNTNGCKSGDESALIWNEYLEQTRNKRLQN